MAYARLPSLNAVSALLSPMFSLPVMVPGGKPVMETPEVPRSPEIAVGPALVTPALPLRTPKVPSEPRSTLWRGLV